MFRRLFRRLKFWGRPRLEVVISMKTPMPKDPDYHDLMSDVWDSREGK